MNEVKDRLCEKVWRESDLVCALGIAGAIAALVMIVIVLIVT